MTARETSAPENRPLSPSEMSLARWMLEHGLPEARQYLDQLAVAKVTPWRCACGCASIDFQIDGHDPAPPGVDILGDFVFGPDDALAGVYIFASNGILRGIEVYGLAGDAPRELPAQASLRPY